MLPYSGVRVYKEFEELDKEGVLYSSEDAKGSRALVLGGRVDYIRISRRRSAEHVAISTKSQSCKSWAVRSRDLS